MQPNQLIDERYRIVSRLGEGRMGVVYSVVDLFAGDVPFALKMLQDPGLVDDFEDEYRFLRRLAHPTFVNAHAFGYSEDAGAPYMVLERVHGVSLEEGRATIDGGRLCLVLLAALEHLHGHGFVHGDIAPPNILCADAGIRILDLGASGAIGSGAGSTSGVLAFAAPERLRGAPLSVASDLFSIGATVFHTLYGQHPFPDYPSRVHPTQVPERRGKSHPLDTVLDRLLAYEPSSRFPSAEAALSATCSVLKQERPSVAWPESREFPFVQTPVSRVILERISDRIRSRRGSFTRIGGSSGGGRTRLCNEVTAVLAAHQIPRRILNLRGHQSDETVVRYLEEELSLMRAEIRVADREGLARNIARRVLHGLGQAHGSIGVLVDSLEHAGPLVRKVFDALEVLLEGLSDRYPGIHVCVTDGTGVGELEALSDAEVEQLMTAVFPQRRVSKTTLGAFQDACHGNPRRLVRALRGAINRGIITSDSTAVRFDLERFLSLELPQSEVEEAKHVIHGMDAAECESLAWVALSQAPVPIDFVRAYGDRWIQAGTVLRLPWGSEPRLVMATDSYKSLVLERYDADALHKQLAELWSTQGEEGLVPRLWHQAHVNPSICVEEIESRLSSLPEGGALALIALLVKGEWPTSPTVGILAAQLAASNGRTDLAESLLGRTLTLECASVQRAECFLLRGRLETRMARLGKARESFLLGLTSEKLPPLIRAKLLEGVSRTAVLLGSLDEAESSAEEGLALTGTDSDALSGRFRYTLGLVSWYRGELDRAASHLKEALVLTRRGEDLVETAAVITAHGLVAHRRGQITIASIYYQEAMHMGEEIGDGSRVLTALQNLGVIHHQEGEWKKALDTYQEALAHAEAEGQTGRIMQLCGNVGNLWRYLGAFDRARRILHRGLKMATDESNRYMEGLLLANLGDVELMDEAFNEADAHLSRALELTIATESVAEELEVRLDLGRLHLELRAYEKAQMELTRVGTLAQSSNDASFKARADALLARCHRENGLGDPKASRKFAKDALERLESVKNLDFRWPILLEACKQSVKAGDDEKASGYATQVLSILQELEDAVPADFKESFRHVSERNEALTFVRPLAQSSDSTAQDRGTFDSRWMGLIEINKRLTTEKDVRRLLEFIMDSSIVLTQAERGFVLLDSDGSDHGLEVHVARNIDQENIRNTKLKISHSIASRVIDEGEPILTIDAMEDTRYRDQLSVHDLKLRSVMCLPMRMRGKVLGAIYLDNRFQAGAFDAEALAFMENFADQAGIALYNARLMEDLKTSKQALEVEREKVESLNARLAEDLALRTRELEETHRVVIAQQQQLTDRHRYESLVGNSKPLRHVFGVMDRLLDNTIPVLITGESGTGKELVARAIHFNGSRSSQPFVALNCGAIPANLIESELFGHVKGAFTGANQDKKGLFEAADKGSLFLDELGELPLEMQVKLLRVLQDGRFKKVGSTSEVQVDVRILAATNRQLESEIANGNFREDLYYRLSVVPIQLPSLRERSGDIPLLVEHFLQKNIEGGMGTVKGITQTALALLKRYDWPGNVRQLEMVLKNVTLFCDNEELDVHDFQSFPDIVQGDSKSRVTHLSGRSLADIERSAIIQALQDNHGNKKRSAEMLGIDRRTLYNKLKTYQIVIEKELHVT